MDIQALIKAEGADDDSQHSNAYRAALLAAYETHKSMTLTQLIAQQKFYRDIYAGALPTHTNTANLVVVYQLIKEKENGETANG